MNERFIREVGLDDYEIYELPQRFHLQHGGCGMTLHGSVQDWNLRTRVDDVTLRSRPEI